MLLLFSFWKMEGSTDKRRCYVRLKKSSYRCDVGFGRWAVPHETADRQPVLTTSLDPGCEERREPRDVAYQLERDVYHQDRSRSRVCSAAHIAALFKPYVGELSNVIASEKDGPLLEADLQAITAIALRGGMRSSTLG
ncbi:hypothetical protein HGRIS_001309 [Hohenbuehelia grisea]|uniref:Uncharacterized protein n=1 Tax=Hohenbuehelia grisea TaxID=104357 RepID=A0ABR3JPQ8_9AGAR